MKEYSANEELFPLIIDFVQKWDDKMKREVA